MEEVTPSSLVGATQTRESLEKAMQSHALAEAKLMGTYGR